MSESLKERHARLAADIARQRGELAGAYENLAKPLQYTEYAMRGVGILRQNPWILSVIPAATSVISLGIGLIRKPSVKGARGFGKGKFFSREAKQDIERDVERGAKLGLGALALKWGGRGWKLFRLYGRLRKYIS
jgi:hypothetical protein